MKLSEVVEQKVYAVVPSWISSSRSAREIDKVKEDDVVKATLVSAKRYLYEPTKRSESMSDFTLAKSNERSVGVLVSAKDKAGTTFYWTSRLVDIVAVYDDLVPRWEKRKQDEQERRRKEDEEQQKKQQHIRNIRERIETSRESVASTTRELLGQKTYVDVSQNGYDDRAEAVVSVSLDSYERLLEMAYAGMDN